MATQYLIQYLKNGKPVTLKGTTADILKYQNEPGFRTSPYTEERLREWLGQPAATSTLTPTPMSSTTNASATQQYLIQYLKNGKPATFKGTAADVERYQNEPSFRAAPYTEAKLREWLGQEETTTGTTNIDALLENLPDVIKNDPAFQALSDDMKAAAAYNYQVQSSGAEEDIKIWNDALTMAQTQAEPYFKNLLRVATDEVNRAMTQLTGDYASRAQQLQTNLLNIKEDLATNRQYLTLEQQADLKKLSQQYAVELDTTKQSMAARGLTFSTNRALAESRLEQTRQGLVESTQRQYGYQVQRLETEAARGSTEAETQLAELKEQLGYQTTTLGRGFESQWGTSALPALQGYAPLGGVQGTMAEEKIKDIAARREALYGEKTRSSLSSIYNY